MTKTELEIINKVRSNFNLLGFDYDRMSSSGQELYDEIDNLLKKLKR